MTAVPAVAAPIHALLAGAIDYAGLFPPASLDPRTALNNYLGYRKGADAWALGRFVVSASVLDQLPPHEEQAVPLSVVVGPEVNEDLGRIEGYRQTSYRIEALEIKGAPDRTISRGCALYFEVPLDEVLEQRLGEIRDAGALAKVRTGGTAPEAFPASGVLTRFLIAAAGLKLPFKATAGLHHPVRGSYQLTYQAGAPSGIMFGYLNLVLAALLAWVQAGAHDVEAALLETSGDAFRFHADAMEWRQHRFDTELLVQVRQRFFHGFGSCSFREPLDELGLHR